MNLRTAFEIAEDDIEVVLRGNEVPGWHGRDYSTLASEIYAGWDLEFDDIAKAALDAGPDLDAQTSAAHEQIGLILREQGFIVA